METTDVSGIDVENKSKKQVSMRKRDDGGVARFMCVFD